MTAANDWFKCWLAKQPAALVAGEDFGDKLLGKAIGLNCSIRYLIRWEDIDSEQGPLPTLLLLLTGTREAWKSVDGTQVERLQLAISRQLQWNVTPIFCEDPPPLEWSLCAFGAMHDPGKVITAQELAEVFRSINSSFLVEPGGEKEPNRGFDDIFQEFTKSLLAREMTVGDIDCIILREFESERVTLLELKCVQEKVETWMPYLNERKAYRVLQRLAKHFSYGLRIVAYDRYQSGRISLHRLSRVKPGNRMGPTIDGKRWLGPPGICLSPSQVALPDYQSDNYKEPRKRGP
jgi:hypothetical protein